MKAGTETGSLTNHLYSRMVKGEPTPKAGDAATLLSWSDRFAATVTDYDHKTGIVTVNEDQSKRVDQNGMSEMQEYEYTRSPEGHGRTASFRKDKQGLWKQVRFNPETKRWNKSDGYGLRLGVRETYHDFSF